MNLESLKLDLERHCRENGIDLDALLTEASKHFTGRLNGEPVELTHEEIAALVRDINECDYLPCKAVRTC